MLHFRRNNNTIICLRQPPPPLPPPHTLPNPNDLPPPSQNIVTTPSHFQTNQHTTKTSLTHPNTNHFKHKVAGPRTDYCIGHF